MTSLTYTPLDPSKKEIRLLLLEAGADDDDLTAHLVHADLDDPDRPEYETISYVWGDATLQESLYIDGCFTFVPQTAVAALRCMRLLEEIRTLWIDSICINQADVEERGRQVSMMADIYSNGSCLLAHVDVSGCEFGLVIESIAGVRSKMADELDEQRKVGYPRPPGGFRQAAPLMLGLTDEAVLALRLWVLQEVTLSKRSTIPIGNKALELDHVFDFISVILLEPMRLLADNSRSLVGTSNAVTLLNSSRLYRQFSHHKHDLQSLISLSDFYGVTDERDYVCALLSLYQRSSGLSTLPPALTPDYTQDVSEAWHARGHNKHTHTQLAGAAGSDGALGSEFTACGTSEALESTRPEFTGEGGRILSVQGVSPDTIHVATPALVEKSDAALTAFLFQVIDLFLPLAQARGTSLQSLGTTLVAAWQSTARKDGASDGEDLADLLSSMQRREGMPLIRRKRTLYSRPYYISLKLACMGRRFFITRGGFIGLGPARLQVGDKVAMLAGGKWPFVLRRRDDEADELYTLVGACYVHSVMDGKAADDYVAKGLPLKRFKVV